MIETFLVSHLRVSLPIFASIRDRIERWLFLQTYQHSQEWHDAGSSFGKQWEALGDQLEYSLHLESIVSPGSKTSHIAVRSRSCTEPFRRIDLLVEASDDGFAYQDLIVLHNVTEEPKLAVMPSIPPIGVSFRRDRSFETPYRGLTVSLVRVSKDEGELACNISGPEHHPNHFLVLNSTYAQRFGRLWNLDWVESKKQDIRNKLRWRIATPRYLPTRGGKYPPGRMLPEICRHLLGRPLFFLIARKWVISLAFWLPIWLRFGSHKGPDNVGAESEGT